MQFSRSVKYRALALISAAALAQACKKADPAGDKKGGSKSGGNKGGGKKAGGKKA